MKTENRNNGRTLSKSLGADKDDEVDSYQESSSTSQSSLNLQSSNSSICDLVKTLVIVCIILVGIVFNLLFQI